MEALLEGLSAALGAGPGLALAAALGWGVLSVLLSPCHLSGIPLVVGYLQGPQPLGGGRALALSSVFSLGVLATLGVLGAVTVGLGRLAGDVGPWGTWAVVAVFLLFGLHLMGVVPLPDWAPLRPAREARGAGGALLLGALFGVGLGPCTFAFMAPVLALAFRAGAAQWGLGVGLMAAFALGHCVVLALAGASAERVQRLLVSRFGRVGAGPLRTASGVLVVLAGLFLASQAA